MKDLKLIERNKEIVMKRESGCSIEYLAYVYKLSKHTIRLICKHANSMNKKTSTMTTRRNQIMTLIVRGLYDKEIATQLSIGHRTVQTHLKYIATHYGLKEVNRVQMACVFMKELHDKKMAIKNKQIEIMANDFMTYANNSNKFKTAQDYIDATYSTALANFS
jgi:DNA-binding CsgD family transcriptional regulator